MATDKPAFPSDEADKFVVRMPPGLRDELKAAAQANNRTMNAEIVARLQAATSGNADLIRQLESVMQRSRNDHFMAAIRAGVLGRQLMLLASYVDAIGANDHFKGLAEAVVLAEQSLREASRVAAEHIPMARRFLKFIEHTPQGKAAFEVFDQYEQDWAKLGDDPVATVRAEIKEGLGLMKKPPTRKKPQA